MLRFCEKRASWCYPCWVYIDSMCKKYIKREHTHVGSSSVAVSKGFYGLFKPNKNSQRCIFRFKSLQDHRFQNGNHRCWPSHMREILCILYSAFGGAKTSKNGPTKSGGMSTVTWSAWNLGCIVHGTHQTSLAVACQWAWQSSLATVTVKHRTIFLAGQGPPNLEVSCDTTLYINFGVSTSFLSCFRWNDTTERLQYSGRPEAKPSKQRPLLNLIQLYWNCTKEGFAAELEYVRLNPINQQDDCPRLGREQNLNSHCPFSWHHARLQPDALLGHMNICIGVKEKQTPESLCLLHSI